VPAFVQRMFELLEEPPHPGPLPRSGGEGTGIQYDIVVPREGEHHHPLAAVYRRSVLESVQKMLAADRLRLRFLFDEVRTREVDVDRLRSVDPQLDTLKNLNAPDDYQDALRSAGFEEKP
jgi:molybdopterin-guanine dinucleotide biosynthesis protein A